MKDLDELLACAARDIAKERMPHGWKASANAPDTLEACTAYFLANNTVHITDYFDPETSIFEKAEDQQAFQAWHDHCHVTIQGTFDPAGERRVNTQQLADFNAWFRKTGLRKGYSPADYIRAAEIIQAHNLGRLDYWSRYGDAPDNFRQFASGYLTARNVI